MDPLALLALIARLEKSIEILEQENAALREQVATQDKERAAS